MPPPTGKPSNYLNRIRFPIRGRRVALVRPDREHLGEVVPLLTDRKIWRWTLHIPYPYTERHGREWVHRSARRWAAGSDVGLLVVRRSDGRVLGGVGLHHLEEGGASGEVGYWIGRPYRGAGYASEAVRLMLRLGFDQLKLHRIEARIFPGNRDSVRLVRRLGFSYEGRLRHEVKKAGKWRDSLLYSRLATDRARRSS